MTYRQNVKAILECVFAGFKDELIAVACERICEIGCDECVDNKGMWIPIPYEIDYQTDAECSLCHGQFIDAIRYNYCPYCGAKMESEVNNG
ncbi:MAG: hypothetical protein J6S67_01975 [Methanobrevibacter sp.]|nr:hypothetical protein [Methanobrevibacter sp.]